MIRGLRRLRLMIRAALFWTIAGLLSGFVSYAIAAAFVHPYGYIEQRHPSVSIDYTVNGRLHFCILCVIAGLGGRLLASRSGRILGSFTTLAASISAGSVFYAANAVIPILGQPSPDFFTFGLCAGLISGILLAVAQYLSRNIIARSSCQFGLRTLFGILILFAIIFGWAGVLQQFHIKNRKRCQQPFLTILAKEGDKRFLTPTATKFDESGSNK